MKNIKILHVDDDRDILLFTKMYLERIAENLQISQVEKPNDAINRLHEGSYDCIISDYKMPEMNGISLATIIKKEQDIPIILYTGQGSEEVAEEAFQVGIDDYQRKESDPGHYTVLAKKINNVVEKSRALKSLHKSVFTYRSVIENATQGIIVVKGQRFMYVNPRVTEISGYTWEELSEMDVLEPVQEAYRDKLLYEFQMIENGVSRQPFHIGYRTKHGDLRYLDIKGIMTEWEGETALMLYVTDLSNAEEKLLCIRESEDSSYVLEQSPVIRA